MDDLAFTLVMTAVTAAGMAFGYILGAADTVCKSELERNGYFVVHHEETHGEFRTNWVEVIRK